MKKTLLALLLFAGCSSNQAARQFGGTETVNLPPGQKLENVTWKDEASLWILTRARREGESAESHTFHEKSQFGFYEGTVILNEQ